MGRAQRFTNFVGIMAHAHAHARACGGTIGAMLVVAGMFPCMSHGQVVPRIPPAPAPQPEYVPPPPPPPPAPVKPAEPEPALSLIERDESGSLKLIEGGVEHAAIKAYAFDAERRERIKASLSARDADIERFVVEHIAEVAAAHKARGGIENVTSFDALNVAREAAKPLRQENVLDRLQRDGALGAPQRARIDLAITEYTSARTAEQSAKTGADVMKIATIVGKQGFNDITRDVFAALDRLCERAAGLVRTDDHGLSLNSDQLGALGRIKSDPGMGAIRTFVLEVLTPEQAKVILGRVAPPPPASPASKDQK